MPIDPLSSLIFLLSDRQNEISPRRELAGSWPARRHQCVLHDVDILCHIEYVFQYIDLINMRG